IDAATHGGIVRIENSAIVFRHELARRAIENSVSDLRRAQMHRAILAHLIERGEPSLARRAHHAAGARDAEASLKFAPPAAADAIAILQNEPGRELAMAYSNQSQLHFLAQERDLAIAFGKKAIDLATTLGDHEILAHALNNVGSATVVSGDIIGFEGLEESLRISLERGYQEHAARAYANLFAQAVRLRHYSRA